MSSNAKRLPEVNLEDFERRLRAAGTAQSAVEDPLEELTRLVNTISTDRPRSEDRSADAAPRVIPTMRPANLDEPEYAPPSPVATSLPAARGPVFNADREDAAAASEAPLLRPSYDEAEPDFSALPPARPEPQYAEAEVVAASGRKPSWYLKVGGIATVGLVMAAGAVYLNMRRVHVAAGGAPPMIMAAEGPSKVAPPDATTVQSSSDAGALLNKDSTVAGGVKIVTHQERPIDLALKGDSPVAPTKDSPIIAPTGGVAMVQPAAPEPAASPPAAAPIVQKKGPKIVSVRPDGTLITADVAPAEKPAAVPPPVSAPLPRKADAGPSVTSQAATPTLDLPPPKPVKTTARVNVAKTDTTGQTDPVNAPLQLGAASAAPAGDKTPKLPTKLRPPEVADQQPAAAPAASGGEWAVQFAAPRSEADAQSAIQKLQTKYASALGDSELVTHKAEVNGETIYRVRATGLSRADAASLCQRVKADGGDCFPTRN